jgi:predicted DNA-binding transcriptional regulator AlpA
MPKTKYQMQFVKVKNVYAILGIRQTTFWQLPKKKIFRMVQMDS